MQTISQYHNLNNSFHQFSKKLHPGDIGTVEGAVLDMVVPTDGDGFDRAIGFIAERTVGESEARLRRDEDGFVFSIGRCDDTHPFHVYTRKGKVIPSTTENGIRVYCPVKFWDFKPGGVAPVEIGRESLLVNFATRGVGIAGRQLEREQVIEFKPQRFQVGIGGWNGWLRSLAVATKAEKQKQHTGGKLHGNLFFAQN